MDAGRELPPDSGRPAPRAREREPLEKSAKKAPPKSAAPEPAAPAPSAAAEPPGLGPAAESPIPPGSSLTIDGLRAQWPAVMNNVKQRTRAVHAYLLESAPRGVAGDEIVLGVRHQFHLERLEDAKNRGIICDALARVFGAPFRLRFLLDETAAADAPPAAAPPPSDRALVDEAIRRFGNPVQEVRRLE